MSVLATVDYNGYGYYKLFLKKELFDRKLFSAFIIVIYLFLQHPLLHIKILSKL